MVFKKAGTYVLILVLPILFLPATRPARCEGVYDSGVNDRTVIGKDAVFQGDVVFGADVYVPPGVTARFKKGSIVRFKKSESTKVEPENILSGTEITIRGAVIAEGTRFIFQGDGGLVVDGGSLDLRDSSVKGAEFGLLLLSGRAETGGLEISDCDTGIMVAGKQDPPPVLAGDTIYVRRCRLGAIIPEGYSDSKLIVVDSPVEFGVLTFEKHFDEAGGFIPDPVDDLKKGFTPDRIVEDLFLDRDEEFRGDVLIRGVVRVAPGARLTIRSGSRVFFDFRDTNDDGIGESGLFLQGTLLVEGSEAEPVIFASAAGSRMGLWDSINFMASDLEMNRVSHAVILESYRGLHSHFSRVHLGDVRIYRTFRGLQFQESEVTIDGLGVFSSISAIRCRDSDVSIVGLYTEGNVSGGNFLRVRGKIQDLFFSDNDLFGLRLRESDIELTGGRVTGGLYSLSLQEGKIRFREISQAESVIAGLRAQESDVEIEDAKFQQNRTYGLSLRDGKYRLENVSITGSGVEKIHIEGKPEVTIK